MNDNQYRGRTAIARSERVQSCVRQLAREHPSFADELRRAFDHFQLLIARRAEPSRTEEGAWERPNPDSLERDDLSRLSDGDFHTVALYRLGGLADMGLARPIVPKPEESGDWKPDMADYRRWARRFPATDHTRHTENPELSVEALPPSIAEEFLAHAEAWVREHAENGAASAESSFQADAPRETGTNTTRASDRDGVVPTGGGGPAAPRYLADAREFVANADAFVAEVERWRTDDGHFVSPGLDRRWRRPLEAMQRIYANRIAPLCKPQTELPAGLGPFDWVRQNHPDGEDRVMLNEDCGHVVARLATERAEHDTVKIPIARVGDAKALLERLRAWLGRFVQRDHVGAASSGGVGAGASTIAPELVAGLEARVAAVETIGKSIADGLVRVSQAIESKTARDDADTPAAKVPGLKPHDRQAWQLATLHGMTQQKVADELNREHGTTYTQGQVSRMIARAMDHANANGLADKVAGKAERPRAVDPGRLELGARVDRRMPRPSDMARADDDDE